MAVIEELIENLIMAHDMLYEDDHTSSGKLDEEDGEQEAEESEDKYAQFEKYINIVAEQFSKFIPSEFENAMPGGKMPDSLTEKLADIGKNLIKTINIVKSARFSREDPGATGNQEVNNIMSSALTSIVSIKGSLDMLANWTAELSRIMSKAGKSKEELTKYAKVLFGFEINESFVHRNSLSSLLLENTSKEPPRGSILYLVKGIQRKDFIDKLGGENAEIVKSIKKHVEKLDKDRTDLIEKTKDFDSVSGAIDKLFGKSRFEEKKGVISKVVGFFKKMFAAAAAAIELQSYTINGESLLGGDDPALLHVNPQKITSLQKAVSGKLDKIKKQVAIARDQLKFGGMDDERISAMVQKDGKKAFDYMVNKKDLFGNYDEDQKPLAGAMISAEYFGENIHRNKMTSLLFEDAAEFIALVNQGIEPDKYGGTVTKNLDRDTVDNLNKIFPKLGGLLLNIEPEQVELPKETEDEKLKKLIRAFDTATSGVERAEIVAQMIDHALQEPDLEANFEDNKVKVTSNSSKDQDSNESGMQNTIFPQGADSEQQDAIDKLQNGEELNSQEEEAVEELAEEGFFDVDWLANAIFNEKSFDIDEETASKIAKIMAPDGKVDWPLIIQKQTLINRRLKRSKIPYELEIVNGTAINFIKIEETAETEKDKTVTVPAEGIATAELQNDLKTVGVEDSAEVAKSIDSNSDKTVSPEEAESFADDNKNTTAETEKDGSTNLTVEPSAEQKDSDTKISKASDLKNYDEDEQTAVELALGDVIGAGIVTESSLHKLGLSILLENKADDFVEKLFDIVDEPEKVQALVKKIKDDKDLKDKLKKLDIDMDETSEKSIPGVTIRPKFMDLINKKKQQLAAKARTVDPKDGGVKDRPGSKVVQKIFNDPNQIDTFEKTYNYIAKNTVKAPIFPEGKRRPKSKLIHKRSLTEALFSDDD